MRLKLAIDQKQLLAVIEPENGLLFSTGDESFVVLRGQSSIGLHESVVR